MLISIQNLRCFGWSYKELFNPNPKRKIRRAFIWSLLALISRNITIAGYLIYLFFLFPEQYFVWLPYDFSFWAELKNQSAVLLWLLLTMLLILFRLFNVGLAAYHSRSGRKLLVFAVGWKEGISGFSWLGLPVWPC